MILLVKDYITKQSLKLVTKFDISSKELSYNLIKQNREIKKISGDEEIVRAFLLTKLVNELGYLPENIEIEKEYDIGRPKVNKPRIDVMVKDNDGNSFLYIEVKSPDEFEKDQDEIIEKQLYNLASQETGQGKKVKYLVLYSFEESYGNLKDKCIIIDYEKYSSFESWEKERNFADELPARYGNAQKEPYKKGGKKDLEAVFTHKELDNLRKELHNVLWGGGGTDDNEIFSSLVNIILAKIQDESEKGEGEKYDFQIFAYDKDNDEIFETPDQIFNRINDLYRSALKERLYITDENILKKSYVIDENKFSLSKLKYVVGKLEKFSFTEGKNSLDGRDILGDFFEGIIRDGFKQSKGQFFTHINVVRLLLWGMQLDNLAIERINNYRELPYMIDPSSGSGSFLIEYMKFITKTVKYRFQDKLNKSKDIDRKFNSWFLPDHVENNWAEQYIYGCEINPNLGTSIKVNMILHGDGSANIFVGSQKGDGLMNFSGYSKTNGINILNHKEVDSQYLDKNVNGKFDVIITNPPFSVEFENDTKKMVNKEFIFGDKKNSENLFIERYYQLLRPNGRLGVVLPESVFDTTENKYIRLFIYKYFKVKAVVSLPQITFEPFTSTKTSLLFAQKKTQEETKQWNDLWSKYSNEWSNLKTRCENLVAVYLQDKDRNKLPSIKDLTPEQEKQILERMLKNYLEEDDKNLSIKDLIIKYKDELADLCKYDNDTKDVFGFVNTWWVFGEVAKELNYKIFMAEVENVGYKRTKRGEKPMKNELFRTDSNDEIIVDDGITETALDYLRQIKWD